jgi:hypothetical protein
MKLHRRWSAFRTVWQCCTALLAASAISVSAKAQVDVPIPSVRFGSINGVAFDSLLMKPIVGAQIELVGTLTSAKTNDKGRFVFNRVPVGRYQIALSNADLDSLGFGTLGAEVTVLADQRIETIIGPPSLRTVWNRNCYGGNTIGADSGVVWGSVRDAATGGVPLNAGVTFEWYNLDPKLVNGLLIVESRKSVGTNSDGIYFACGLPTRIAVSSTGVSDSSASGRISIALGDRSVQRLDLALSTEMLVRAVEPNATAEDAVNAEKLRGTASIRGRVIDNRNKPMENAIVALVGAEEVARTRGSGEFSLSNLPAGTHNLSVRRIGQEPVMQTVQLRPSEQTEVLVTMSSAVALTTVNVFANRSKSRLRLEYEQRRKSALGYAIDGSVIEKRADLYSIFRDFRHMIVDRDGFGLSIVTRTILRGRCAPQAFLDGFPVEMALASSLPTDMYRGIEVYENPFMVPAEYITTGTLACGAVLFWTKRIAW